MYSTNPQQMFIETQELQAQQGLYLPMSQWKSALSPVVQQRIDYGQN